MGWQGAFSAQSEAVSQMPPFHRQSILCGYVSLYFSTDQELITQQDLQLTKSGVSFVIAAACFSGS